MDRNKKNMIQLIVLLIILVAVIILAVKVFNRNTGKQNGEQVSSSGIDASNPIYNGMKIYEKDGDTIIEGADGSKTIETTKTKEDTGLEETTDKEKQKYEISNVKVEARATGTLITGNVKNNDNSNHTVIVNIKFYGDDNKIKGATSTKLQINKQETKEFSMTIMDDMTKYKYNIVVEYED